MKAKVVIENGLTTIVLTPENEFEKDVIEKVDNNKAKYDMIADTSVKNAYGVPNSQEIYISLKEKQ